MSITLQGSPGSLFAVLGKCGLLAKQARTCQLAQKTNLIDPTNGLIGQLFNQPDIEALVGSSYLTTLTGPENACQLASQIAQLMVNRLVYQDNPRISQTLQSLNLVDSLNEVIRQMKVQGASVLAMTIGATSSSITGVGSGALVASTKQVNGLVCENSFAETLTVTCTQDSYSGGATAGNEPFTVTGTGGQSDVFAWNWPLGSDATAQLSAIDGSQDDSSGNLLTNSGFDTWTSNVPDNWHLTTGVAGTDIVQERTLTYKGVSALKLVGDGATKVAFWQQFGVDTAGTLGPLAQYAFNIWLRRDGTAAGAGTLVVELVDSRGNVINDQNGVANQFSISLTGLTTTYTAYNGVFRTPLILPSSQYIRLRLSTALTNARSVYLDLAGLGEMTSVYQGGPSLAQFSGNVPFAAGDFTTCAISNSRGAGGTLSTFQTLCDQFFGMRGLDLLLPSSAIATLSDAALIA